MQGCDGARRDALALFGRDLDQLVQELWTWSPTRWSDERIAVARGLALDLLASAREAGDADPGLPLPVVAPYGLADQIAVLGHDLLAAPDAERAAAQVLSHLAAARAALNT